MSEVKLFAVIDRKSGKIVPETGAPFDGMNAYEAITEVAATYCEPKAGKTAEQLVEAMGWGVVPLTAELEKQYLALDQGPGKKGSS